ncbi:MAG: Npt1/Npt2 family nucleotide transporter, partial [Myxococcota bacterium]
MNEAGSSERAASPLVVWTGTFIAALTIAQQVASKAIRDGLFLSEFEVTSLPYVVSTGAAISFASAIVVGRAMSRRSPAVVVPSLFVMQACAFLLESLALSHYPRVTAAVLYLHTAAFGGAVVSGFWSVINERFDPYTARKVIGRIAGGATVGGMVGGGLTWALSDFSSQSLLRLLFAANLLAALLVARLAGGGRRSAAGRVPLLDGFRVLARFGYPRMIAALVFILALSITLIDYVFKASVADARSGPELVSFFAVFYAATGISTFAVQLLATRPLLRSLGVVQTAALLPLLALVFLAVCVVSPTMGTLVLLQGLIMTVENSLFRSSYELLYTPIPKKQKRSAKILIDLGVDRLGTAAGSALALLTIAALGTQMSRALLLDAALLAVAALVVLGFLRRQYVATLATQIRASFGDEGEGVWSDVH